MTAAHAPNHHHDHPPFAGASGLVAALSMAVGRRRDAELAARLSALAPGDRLVDIGSGPGGPTRHAARAGATVTGVDPAPVMRRVARFLGTRRGAIRFVGGTAEALPLGDGDATVAWALASVHHWADVDEGLREVRRVLDTDGRFLAVERRTVAGARGLASHGWTDEQADAFAAACRRCGFAHVRVERARHRHPVLAVVAVRS